MIKVNIKDTRTTPELAGRGFYYKRFSTMIINKVVSQILSPEID